jgi:hypothetical protein
MGRTNFVLPAMNEGSTAVPGSEAYLLSILFSLPLAAWLGCVWWFTSITIMIAGAPIAVSKRGHITLTNASNTK